MQKQPPEVFCKKAIVKKITIFTEKTPLLESLFNSEYCKIFKSIYFEEHLWAAAFKMCSWNREKTKIAHKKF